MSKIKNKYIKKAKRKKRIKRIIVLLIFVIILGTVFVTKTDTFLITNVECSGENLVTGDYVLEKGKTFKGENLFLLSKKTIEDTLRKNPYIDTVKIKKKLPNTIIVEVTEKKGLFYIYDGDYNNIISEEMMVLEKKDTIDGDELIKISGIDLVDVDLGQKFSKSNRVASILEEIYKEQSVIKNNKEDFSITELNIGDLSDIKVYFGNIEIKIGSDKNLRKKMSDAVNIYKSGLVTEYIDVSFDGTPDFK